MGGSGNGVIRIPERVEEGRARCHRWVSSSPQVQVVSEIIEQTQSGKLSESRGIHGVASIMSLTMIEWDFVVIQLFGVTPAPVHDRSRMLCITI